VARKTRQEKEAARLREALRAQTGSRPAAEASESEEPAPARTEISRRGDVPRASARYIKSGLLRSAILTAAALGIIALLYLLL